MRWICNKRRRAHGGGDAPDDGVPRAKVRL